MLLIKILENLWPYGGGGQKSQHNRILFWASKEKMIVCGLSYTSSTLKLLVKDKV